MRRCTVVGLHGAGLTAGAPQADVPDAAGPNNALEPTAPMAACTSSASSMARRLTAGVGQQQEEYNLASYASRYVAFLDILGFKDLIS